MYCHLSEQSKICNIFEVKSIQKIHEKIKSMRLVIYNVFETLPNTVNTMTWRQFHFSTSDLLYTNICIAFYP